MSCKTKSEQAPATTLRQVGENDIIRQLIREAPTQAGLLIGPGDDCAVVQGNEEWDFLLKTDVVVEGIHFLRESSPALIGRKALARAISDIAAMGGLPQHALITLLVHPERSMAMLNELYQEGIYPLARQYGISIAGGETSSLPYDGFIINIALTGVVERRQAILRSKAQVGDLIAVSGKLGGSFESERHLRFEPRLKLARQLMKAGLAPHAMMDLSDGLAVDLKRLAEASQLSYEIDESKLPCHAGCTPQQALQDGEDYELLMCISPEQWGKIQHIDLSCPITIIGRMLEKTQEPPAKENQVGWTHFCSQGKKASPNKN